MDISQGNVSSMPECIEWNPHICIEIVDEMFRKLNVGKSVGSDGLSPRLLRGARDSLVTLSVFLTLSYSPYLSFCCKWTNTDSLEIC